MRNTLISVLWCCVFVVLWMKTSSFAFGRGEIVAFAGSAPVLREYFVGTSILVTERYAKGFCKQGYFFRDRARRRVAPSLLSLISQEKATNELLVSDEFAQASNELAVQPSVSGGSGGVDQGKYPVIEFDFETSGLPAVAESKMSVMKMFNMLREEAAKYASSLLLSHQMQKHVLIKHSLTEAISSVLASKMCSEDLPEHLLYNRFMKSLNEHPKLVADMVHDLMWIQEIDPATHGYLQPFLYFKGFHAIQVQRIGHALWVSQDSTKKMLALSLQSRACEVFGVDAHPGAKLDHSICLDHASGVVIGETATIGHNCYILHGVTLGATGKQNTFDRHPKVGSRVKIGAGAMVLGNINIANDVVVGAAAIVTVPIKEGETVVGINRVLTKEQRQAALMNSSTSTDTWMYNI